jgi:hypothetical protein
MSFIPDYTQIKTVLHNKQAMRLPLYEHHIEQITETEKLKNLFIST